MTPQQLELVPDHVLTEGQRLLDYLADRGIRHPSLLDIERERVRRGIRQRLAPAPLTERRRHKTSGEQRRQTKAIES